MDRRTTAAWFLGAVVLAGALGWLLGQRISSPAEIAARTAAPDPSPILVPVESRVLSTDIVTRGTGRFGTPRDLSLVPTDLSTGAEVVTLLPPVGAEVGEAEVLLTVSGRPVIVLEGTTPSFRDLGPGMSGPDVLQLESALDRLGYPPGSVDGSYDDETGAAVGALYDHLGFEPISLTPDQMAELPAPLGTLTSPSETNVLVAADELYFTTSLPVRVAEVLTSLGQVVEGPLLTVTDANVAIDGSVPIEQSQLVRVGMPVAIDEPDLGISANGVISRVAAGPGTDGADGFHVYFEVTVEAAPPTLVNASVRLTIPVETTLAEVLAVPVAALSLAADGSAIVQVDRDGILETVSVRAGLSAQGFVEVVSADPSLSAGDLVLVGFDMPRSVEEATQETLADTTVPIEPPTVSNNG